MPLYTLWRTGTTSEIVFAIVHCTGGDMLIALSALVVSLVLFGSDRWPAGQFRQVGVSTVLIGLGYTVFSEWLNTEIRGAWAYSDLMPVIPLLNAGFSPLAQWVAIPVAGFWWVRKRQRDVAQC